MVAELENATEQVVSMEKPLLRCIRRMDGPDQRTAGYFRSTSNPNVHVRAQAPVALSFV